MSLKFCHRCGRTQPKGHTHRATDRRPSYRARGYDTQWQATRKAFLSTHPICQWHEGCLAPATDVHHIDGQGPKGPRGHDFTNLQALCHPHHSKVTASEVTATGSFIVLVGPTGTGKTTIRRLLAQRLDLPDYGPDDTPAKWGAIYPKLDRADQAIVECNRMPAGLRARAKEREALIVHLTAPPQVRYQRLRQRGIPHSLARQVTERPDATIGYEERVVPHLTIETTADPETIAVQIADRWGGG